MQGLGRPLDLRPRNLGCPPDLQRKIYTFTAVCTGCSSIRHLSTLAALQRGSFTATWPRAARPDRAVSSSGTACSWSSPRGWFTLSVEVRCR